MRYEISSLEREPLKVKDAITTEPSKHLVECGTFEKIKEWCAAWCENAASGIDGK